MALHQVRTDDITNEPDAQSVVITVNGQGVEIDLGAKSIERLTKALQPFWNVGTESAYNVTRALRGTPRKAKGDRGWTPGEVREWATRNGLEVSTRGRIPQDLVDQYLRS